MGDTILKGLLDDSAINQSEAAIRLDNIGFENIISPLVGEMVRDLASNRRFREFHRRLAPVGDASRNWL